MCVWSQVGYSEEELGEGKVHGVLVNRKNLIGMGVRDMKMDGKVIWELRLWGSLKSKIMVIIMTT